MKIHRGGQYPQSTPMQKLSQIHSHRLSCFSRPGEYTACQLPTGPEMGGRKCHHPDTRRNPRGRTAVWSLAFVHSSVHAATRHTQPLCLRPFIAPSNLQDVIRLFVYLPVSLYVSNQETILLSIFHLTTSPVYPIIQPTYYPCTHALLEPEALCHCTPRNRGSCHLRPWGVTAAADGDKRGEGRARVLTRTDSLGHGLSWVPERPRRLWPRLFPGPAFP